MILRHGVLFSKTQNIQLNNFTGSIMIRSARPLAQSNASDDTFSALVEDHAKYTVCIILILIVAH